MMRSATFIFLLVLISCTSVFAESSGPAEVKDVLVLHAYHQGFEWTDRVTQGIESVIQPFRKDIKLHFEYLDCRRNSGEAYYTAFNGLLQQKLTFRTPAVTIVSDIEALQFVRNSDIEPLKKSPVVFCGVPKDHFTHMPKRNEIGVFEQLDHNATLRLMLSLHPDCRKILILAAEKYVLHRSSNAFEKVLEPFRQQVAIELLSVSSVANLPARLVGLDGTDLVYLLALDQDQGEDDAEADRIAGLVARWSPVPVYSSQAFYLGKGIVGGMITTGIGQGELAARLTLRLLSGQRPQDLPVMHDSPNKYMFDGRQLQRFGIKKGQLPFGSTIVNPLPELWQRHGLIFLGLVAGLLLLNGLLFVLLLRQRLKQQDLVQANMELDSRMREKSAHLQLANQRLKKQCLTDGVTGMPNRRHVYQRLVEEVKKARRYDHPLAVLVLNVDGYKQINDTHDYLLAENILRDLGHTVKRCLREVDLVGRYGGEAFLVVMPNTDQGQHAAERIRQAATTLQWESGEVRITISAGMAQLEKHTPPELISVAESRLELAKSMGGNRVVAADADI